MNTPNFLWKCNLKIACGQIDTYNWTGQLGFIIFGHQVTDTNFYVSFLFFWSSYDKLVRTCSEVWTCLYKIWYYYFFFFFFFLHYILNGSKSSGHLVCFKIFPCAETPQSNPMCCFDLTLLAFVARSFFKIVSSIDNNKCSIRYLIFLLLLSNSSVL